MYTILVSNSEDEIKQTIKEIYSSSERLHFMDQESVLEQNRSLHCLISTAKGIYNIPHKEILFVESEQKKSIIHLTNGSISLPVPLYRIREVLPEPYFLQTHRSFIINLENASFIDKTKDPWVISFFKSNKTAFISRSFKKAVIDTLTPFLNCVID